LKYVTNQATRIIVKAAGELFANASQAFSSVDEPKDTEISDAEELAKEALQAEDVEQRTHDIDIERYMPKIDDSRGWILSELDLGMFLLLSHDVLIPNGFDRMDRRRMWRVRNWGWRVSLSSIPGGSPTDA
jgi:hypothetical protein